jgi:hypothetical protein
LQDTSVPVRRAQMLTASTNARGIGRVSMSASQYADLFLIDAETQKPVAGARIEAMPEEGDGDDGFLVRVSKDGDGYRPELVRVRRGQQRTVPLVASTPDVPGRAVRLSQKVYDDEFLGEADLAGVSAKAEQEGRPEIVFVPVLDASTMQGARFHMYRSPLPATLLALKVEGNRPANGTAVRSRSRVVSTTGSKRAGARVQPAQVTAAAEKRDDDAHQAPTVSSLVVAAADGNGDAMVTWGVQDPESRVLAFEVGVDTTRPSQRLAPQARNLGISVRRGEHFVCVRPVFAGADLDSEVSCQWFEAAEAPPAANVRVRVRPMAAGTLPKRRQPMPVEVEVENLGTVDADPFKVDVVLSRDGRTEGGLGEVRTVTVDGIKAGGMAIRRTEITPPRDGSLYVVARADSSRRLIETNAEDNLDRLPVTVMPMGDNRSPILSVAGTAVGGGESGRLVRGTPLRLQANADDPEDGNLSTAITWISSRDGTLAQGAKLDTATLTPGVHRVRAQVADLGRPSAQLPPAAAPWWRRLFWSDPPAPTFLAAEPPETVTAEFTIEVVDSEQARSGQSPPAVSAGPDLTTTEFSPVVPLASASDPDGDALTFAWTAKNAEGGAVEILDADKLFPRFIPSAPGRYRLVLVVNDGTSEERDEVEVLALAAASNRAPQVSVVLAQSSLIGTLVRAEAFAADEDGDGLTVTYDLERPPTSTVLLTDGETFSPAFTPDVPGLYRLTVTADDGRGRTAQAQASTYASGGGGQPDAGGNPDVPVPEPDGGTQPDTGTITALPNGASCSVQAGCQSGHCVNNVCCDTACLGLCSSCNRAGLVGACGPVAAGQDPRDECPSSGTCNGQGACSPLAVRPGSEVIVSGSIDLAGDSSPGGDPSDEDRRPVACDPVSGMCAFLRPPDGGQTPGARADLMVVDGRGSGPLTPRLISSDVNPFGSVGEGSRPGFVRGTLLYATTTGDVFAWRVGWSEPHHLAPAGSSCAVSRGGRYAACYGNRRPSGNGELYDLLLGTLTDGGNGLAAVATHFHSFNDRYGWTPVFSSDEAWLATSGRASEGALPSIELRPLPSGAAVTVVAEENLDGDAYFSPDGRWIAFQRQSTPSEGEDVGTLAIANVSATPMVRDVVPATSGFAWWQAPGGANQLLFIRDIVGMRGTMGKIADPANPQPVVVADKVYPFQIVFSGATGRMAVVRDANDDFVYELWAIDLGSGALTQLASGMSFASGASMFSPDGNKLAWGAYVGDKPTMFLSSLSMSSAPPLPIGGSAMRLEWTSVGSLLFTEGVGYRVSGVTPIGSQATLRLYDGGSYPPRVLQPGVRDHFAVTGDQVLFVVSGQGGSDGLYRLRLGAPPGTSSCDPLQQNGCDEGSACFLRGPGDVTACGIHGSGGLQASCSANTDCYPGYQCHDGACWKICDVNGSVCPGETPYCQVAPGNASLGLCFPPPPEAACDPVRMTGCFGGEVCQVNSDGIHVCAPPGGAGVGQTCEQTGECSAGLGCYFDGDGTRCRPYCDTRSPACPSQTPLCRYGGGSWVGYCAAPSGETGCDPVEQSGCSESSCYGYQAGGYTACQPAGALPANTPCSASGDCASGLGCFDGINGRLCRPYCYLGASTCPQEASYCQGFAPGYGYCMPYPDFPPPPDGSAPPPPDGGAQQL